MEKNNNNTKYPAACICIPKSRRETIDSDMEDEFERRLPETNNLIKGRKDSYAVGRKLAQGRFGAVYEVLRKSDGKPMAAKLEVCDSHSHGLDMDYIVLRKAAKLDVPYFAQMVDRGRIESHFKFIVMQLMGDNLWKLRTSFVENRFSLGTALRLAIHCLAPIQQLHNMGFVHRDIKEIKKQKKQTRFEASNFVVQDMRPGAPVRICIVDFGLSKCFLESDGATYRRPREKVTFRGTTRYASLAAHNECDHSPKDDLESWFYMVVEFISGILPWSDLHRDDKEKVKEMKEEARTPEGTTQLLAHCPKMELRRIFTYLCSLTYQSHPDYTYIGQLLSLAMKNYGIHMDDEYDWENNQ